jgi:hypothetical protein
MIDWNRLLADHGPLVWQTAYRLTGNRADAEDVFQDTFLAALKVPLPVRSWPALLRHLATVQGLNRLRQRARRPQPLGDQDPPASADQEPETQAHANELADRLRAYAAKHDGNFPKKLDDWVAYRSIFTADQKDGELSPAALALATRLGMVTAGLSMTKPADQGYHGDGVRLGAKEVIIFWHRDAHTQVVSAVFGDLRTAEVAEEQLPKKR